MTVLLVDPRLLLRSAWQLVFDHAGKTRDFMCSLATLVSSCKHLVRVVDHRLPESQVLCPIMPFWMPGIGHALVHMSDCIVTHATSVHCIVPWGLSHRTTHALGS